MNAYYLISLENILSAFIALFFCLMILDGFAIHCNEALALGMLRAIVISHL